MLRWFRKAEQLAHMYSGQGLVPLCTFPPTTLLSHAGLSKRPNLDRQVSQAEQRAVLLLFSLTGFSINTAAIADVCGYWC